MSRIESNTCRHPNKNMSYAHSARNAYANILSCPANLGAQKEEQHYNLFFNNSTASSIPLIRLPENIKTTRSVDFSSSSLDYSDLFQGLNDHQDMDVSYQDLTTSSCNVRYKKCILICLLPFFFFFFNFSQNAWFLGVGLCMIMLAKNVQFTFLFSMVIYFVIVNFLNIEL